MVTDPPAQNKFSSFSHRVRARARSKNTWLCVGLDPDLQRLPSPIAKNVEGIVDFCTAVIESTSDFALAYKIQFAFFEVLGAEGWRALATVRQSIPPEIPVIADAKRGDIGNTSRAYAKSIFEVLGFDAVTANPYMGHDSLQPFMDYSGKHVFVLSRTSNPGAADFQDLGCAGDPLYMQVARKALALESHAEVGFVVGATEPEAVRRIRSLSQDLLLLLVGVGAQGASLAEAIMSGSNEVSENALISVSREILYASGDADYAHAARSVAATLAKDTWQEPRVGSTHH